MWLPQTQQLDARLLAGSAVFGIGWGWVDICPGPSLLVLGSGSGRALIFVVAMLVGMSIVEALAERGSHRGN